jgi:hypothetical protein
MISAVIDENCHFRLAISGVLPPFSTAAAAGTKIAWQNANPWGAQ